MKLKTFLTAIAITILALITAACSASSSSIYSAQNPKALEVIYGFKVQDGKMWFGVRSTGCTRVEDFAIKQERLDDLTRVKLHRVKKDRCRKKPFVTSIAFPIMPTANTTEEGDRLQDSPDHAKNASKTGKIIVANPFHTPH